MPSAHGLLIRLDHHIRAIAEIREALTSELEGASPDHQAWRRVAVFDQADFRYPWPDATEDLIGTLHVWQAPADLGGGLFGVGVNVHPTTVFGGPRKYAGVFVLGAEGGSARHVVNFNEDDRGGWAALIRGAGASGRGYFRVGDSLPDGYEALEIARHSDRLETGWDRACVVAGPDDEVTMLTHAALQARDRDIRPMGS